MKVSCTHCSIHYPFPIELFSLISPTISFLFFSDPFTHETIILKTQFMKLIRNQISAKFGMLFDFTNTQQLSWQRQRWRRHEDIQWEFLLYILFTFTETAVYCFSLEKERMKKKNEKEIKEKSVEWIALLGSCEQWVVRKKAIQQRNICIGRKSHHSIERRREYAIFNIQLKSLCDQHNKEGKP